MQNFDLVEESKYRPENCRGFSQAFLVYLHIYCHYLWDEYEQSKDLHDDIIPPPSTFTKVQGKPGTGKTFVVNTIQNITRNIFQSDRFDAGSAPTGCAAALFGGKHIIVHFIFQLQKILHAVPRI